MVPFQRLARHVHPNAASLHGLVPHDGIGNAISALGREDLRAQSDDLREGRRRTVIGRLRDEEVIVARHAFAIPSGHIDGVSSCQAPSFPHPRYRRDNCFITHVHISRVMFESPPFAAVPRRPRPAPLSASCRMKVVFSSPVRIESCERHVTSRPSRNESSNARPSPNNSSCSNSSRSSSGRCGLSLPPLAASGFAARRSGTLL